MRSLSNIWVAASDNERARVEELISTGEFSAVSKDENGYTPIHAAAAYGHLDLLEWLLSLPSADSNVTDNDSDTPLHHCECADAARMLIAHSANIHALNDEKQTPLDVAIEDQRVELIEYLSTLVEPETSIDGASDEELN